MTPLINKGISLQGSCMPTAITFNVHIGHYALMFVIDLVVHLLLYFLQLDGFENVTPFFQGMDLLNYWWQSKYQ